MAVRRTELARVRKAAGYSQESLADAMHVDRSTVVRWEAGSNDPQAYQQPKLARLLGVDAEALRGLLHPAGIATVAATSIQPWSVIQNADQAHDQLGRGLNKEVRRQSAC